MKTKAPITRRDMLRQSVAGMGGLVAGHAAAQEASILGEAGRRPRNVLYINTDQQRWDAMGCAGSPFVKTPHMDRLAREGVQFTHAITPQPMCTAARTAIMTGLSIHTTNCVAATWDEDMRFPTDTFDQHLAKQDYACEYHGRYHSPMVLTDAYANPVTLDFSAPYRKHLRATCGEPPAPKAGQFKNYMSDWPYIPDPPDFHWRQAHDKPPRHGVEGVNYGIDTTPKSYSAFVAEETIDALRRNKDKPFCITSAYLHPHHPQYILEAWKDRVKPEDMEIPATMRHRRENTPWENNAWQIDELDMEHMKLLHARYYQLVEETDHEIGRVLNALDDLGLTDSTLVIFLSDHGEFLGWHGLMQKFLPYEESIRAPYIMRLPGAISAGAKVERPVNLMDTYATIFDYLGLTPPPQEGHSLRPLIEGSNGGYPEFTFSEFGRESGYTLFTSREWKYVWNRPEAHVDELYNLQEDPLETNNLLGSHPGRSKYLAEAGRIREAMAGWMETIKHPYLEQLAKSEIA